MMLDRAGKLRIIDFDRYDFGDPWRNSTRIPWCAQASPHFATGLFKRLFRWRAADGILAASGPLPRQQPAFLRLVGDPVRGEGEIDTMLNQAKGGARQVRGHDARGAKLVHPGACMCRETDACPTA